MVAMHNALRAAPSKMVAGAFGVIGIWATLWPESTREWLNWAWHTRAVGWAFLSIFALWWFAIWWTGRTKSSHPIRIFRKLYIDCDPIGHKLGGPAFHLYSASYCIEVENASDSTIRGLKAVIRDKWGEDSESLIIRGQVGRVADINPYEKVRIEIGRITMQMEPGHVPGIERGEGYWVLSDGEINGAYNQEKGVETFNPSAGSDRLAHVEGQKMEPFDVIVTAANTPAQIVRMQGDLWHTQARERMEIKSIGRSK